MTPAQVFRTDGYVCSWWTWRTPQSQHQYVCQQYRLVITKIFCKNILTGIYVLHIILNRHPSMRGEKVYEIYKEYAQLFKVLSDPNRLMIVDMLSCGELCACVILEKFQITQPTLSHHMKILCDCKLVSGRKEGKWTYYSLNSETVRDFRTFLEKVTTTKKDCICREKACEGDCE